MNCISILKTDCDKRLTNYILCMLIYGLRAHDPRKSLISLFLVTDESESKICTLSAHYILDVLRKVRGVA